MCSSLFDSPMIRSEEMTLVQLVERNDAARAIINELGEASLLHFRDMNKDLPSYKRAFTAELKKCDDISRKLAYLTSMLETYGFSAAPPDLSEGLPPLVKVEESIRFAHADRMSIRNQELHVAKAHNALKEHIHILGIGSAVFAPPPSSVSRLEEGLESAATTMVGAASVAVAAAMGLVEGTLSRFQAAGHAVIELQAATSASGQQPLLANDFLGTLGEDSALHILAGTVVRGQDAKHVRSLTRAVHRITRGNCFLYDCPINEDLLGMPPDGNAREPEFLAKNFVMFIYSGAVIHTKVKKVCQHFGCSMYDYPEGRGARMALQARLGVQLMEMEDLYTKTISMRKQSLSTLSMKLGTWTYVVEREKATLHALNMLDLDLNRKVFTGEGWVLTRRLPELKMALYRGSMAAGGDTKPILNELDPGPKKAVPPTHIHTNRFTQGFQNLVDTYGIPRYQEVNPGAFAVILFPFLFAIMFGDVGHGAMLVLLAMVFIILEEKLLKTKLDDIVGMAFTGRYVLLLNGLFAMYTGLLYNECFSIPMGIWPSTWSVDEDAPKDASAVWDGTVYPFGVDPMWQKAANKMSFFNSFKMKVSGCSSSTEQNSSTHHSPLQHDSSTHRSHHSSPLTTPTLPPSDLNHLWRLPNDVRHMLLLSKPPAFQGLPLDQIRLHPRDRLLPRHLRLPYHSNLCEVGDRLGRRGQSRALAPQYLDCDVHVARGLHGGVAHLSRSGVRTAPPTALRRRRRALFTDTKASTLLPREEGGGRGKSP